VRRCDDRLSARATTHAELLRDALGSLIAVTAALREETDAVQVQARQALTHGRQPRGARGERIAAPNCRALRLDASSSNARAPARPFPGHHRGR
jgi:hypothetical protein